MSPRGKEGPSSTRRRKGTPEGAGGAGEARRYEFMGQDATEDRAIGERGLGILLHIYDFPPLGELIEKTPEELLATPQFVGFREALAKEPKKEAMGYLGRYGGPEDFDPEPKIPTDQYAPSYSFRVNDFCDHVFQNETDAGGNYISRSAITFVEAGHVEQRLRDVQTSGDDPLVQARRSFHTAVATLAKERVERSDSWVGSLGERVSGAVVGLAQSASRIRRNASESSEEIKTKKKSEKKPQPVSKKLTDNRLAMGVAGTALFAGGLAVGFLIRGEGSSQQDLNEIQTGTVNEALELRIQSLEEDVEGIASDVQELKEYVVAGDAESKDGLDDVLTRIDEINANLDRQGYPAVPGAGQNGEGNETPPATSSMVVERAVNLTIPKIKESLDKLDGQQDGMITFTIPRGSNVDNELASHIAPELIDGVNETQDGGDRWRDVLALNLQGRGLVNPGEVISVAPTDQLAQNFKDRNAAVVTSRSTVVSSAPVGSEQVITGLPETGGPPAEESQAPDGRDRAEEQGHKINICHRTGSDSHPIEVINVDTHAFDGEGINDHTKHRDFPYEGPTGKNGHPTKEGNKWCEEKIVTPTSNPVETPAVTAPPVETHKIPLPKTGGQPPVENDRFPIWTMAAAAVAAAAGARVVTGAIGWSIWNSRQAAVAIPIKELRPDQDDDEDDEDDEDHSADEHRS